MPYGAILLQHLAELHPFEGRTSGKGSMIVFTPRRSLIPNRRRHINRSGNLN